MTVPVRITETQSLWLNLIRTICSQGVLIGHCIHYFAFDAGLLTGLPSYCVLVFFVLSGFLIAHSTERKLSVQSNYSFNHYFVSRFIRIYPPLIGSLILVFVIDIIGFEMSGKYYSLPSYFRNFFINLLLLQEFPLATFINEHHMIEMFRFPLFGTNLPLWTISIEWWIYLFYGYVLINIIKKNKTGLRWLIIALLLGITPVYYTLIGTRMDKGLPLFWFLGVLILFIVKNDNAKKIPQKLLPAGKFLVIAGLSLFSLLGYYASIIVFAIGLGLIMVNWSEKTTAIETMLKRPLQRTAGFSYSLYLIHYPILYFIFTVFTVEQNVFNFILILLIVNIIAFSFSQVFETMSKKMSITYENYRSRRNRL